MKKLLVDVDSQQEMIVDLDETELAFIEKSALEAETETGLANEKAAARAALLEKLGITEEEAKLLLS